MTWQKIDNHLEKNFSFKNFTEAVDFVNQVAKVAEKMNHHPDVLIHDYKHVRIQITTHDQNAVTEKDYELAEGIDRIFS